VQTTIDASDPLAGIPECVVDSLRRALATLARLEMQRAGYKRMGLGDRCDADLDAAGAGAKEVVAEFTEYAPRNGVDPVRALAAIKAAL
jgi:hypothetical protein